MNEYIYVYNKYIKISIKNVKNPSSINKNNTCTQFVQKTRECLRRTLAGVVIDVIVAVYPPF